MFDTTIAAISTGFVKSGLGTVRLSGTDAKAIAKTLLENKYKKKFAGLSGYQAMYAELHDDGVFLDEAVLLYFCSPKSYTGEDVVEISCHGGLYVLKRILRMLINNGAAAARPGEFTERAFLNGKLDLTKAESVIDLINANTEMSHAAASGMMNGRLFKEIKEISNTLKGYAAEIAAWVDFPEDDLSELNRPELKAGILDIITRTEKLISGYDSGIIARNGVKIVLAGAPNVGKSTLMNLLSGFDRSIVTDEAGTTRDTVEEQVDIDGIPAVLIDTAGLRETKTEAERLGVERTKKSIAQSRLALFVFDGTNEIPVLGEIDGKPVIPVVNKADRGITAPLQLIREKYGEPVIISALTGEGAGALKKEIKKKLKFCENDVYNSVCLNERQHGKVSELLTILNDTVSELDRNVTADAIGVNIFECLALLGEITGESASEEIIAEVFKRFCVGK